MEPLVPQAKLGCLVPKLHLDKFNPSEENCQDAIAKCYTSLTSSQLDSKLITGYLVENGHLNFRDSQTVNQAPSSYDRMVALLSLLEEKGRCKALLQALEHTALDRKEHLTQLNLILEKLPNASQSSCDSGVSSYYCHGDDDDIVGNLSKASTGIMQNDGFSGGRVEGCNILDGHQKVGDHIIWPWDHRTQVHIGCQGTGGQETVVHIAGQGHTGGQGGHVGGQGHIVGQGGHTGGQGGHVGGQGGHIEGQGGHIRSQGHIGGQGTKVHIGGHGIGSQRTFETVNHQRAGGRGHLGRGGGGLQPTSRRVTPAAAVLTTTQSARKRAVSAPTNTCLERSCDDAQTDEEFVHIELPPAGGRAETGGITAKIKRLLGLANDPTGGGR